MSQTWSERTTLFAQVCVCVCVCVYAHVCVCFAFALFCACISVCNAAKESKLFLSLRVGCYQCGRGQ